MYSYVIVDDEPLIRSGIRSKIDSFAESLGLLCVGEANNGREALALIATHPEISLLFTDIVMPGGMFGDELAREARMLRPDLKVLFTSGYAEPSLAGRELAEGSWLKKPYTSKELAARLRSLLD